MAQGSWLRAAFQSSLAASSGPPPESRASLKASSNSRRRFDLPAGFPDCPGLHLVTSLPDIPGLNLLFLFVMRVYLGQHSQLRFRPGSKMDGRGRLRPERGRAVSFVPRLVGQIWQNADLTRRCRFRNSQQKRASDLDSTYGWIPKLDVAGSSPVSRSKINNLRTPQNPSLR